MANVLVQKGLSFGSPLLNYKVDARGIAYDLTTGQSLSGGEVQRRIAAFKQANPTAVNPDGTWGAGKDSAQYSELPKDVYTGRLPSPGYPIPGDNIGNSSGYTYTGGNMPTFNPSSGYSTNNPFSGNTGNNNASGSNGWVQTGLNFLGGVLNWTKDNKGAIGDAAKAALEYKAKQEEIAQRAAEFERTQGQSESKDAVGAQNLLNRAPMADQAQYLLRARMGAAPTTFAPRDFTRGPMTPATMAAPATGGPQDRMAAGSTTAAGYKPGMGGVDTSVIQMLRDRMIDKSSLDKYKKTGG